MADWLFTATTGHPAADGWHLAHLMQLPEHAVAVRVLDPVRDRHRMLLPVVRLRNADAADSATGSWRKLAQSLSPSDSSCATPRLVRGLSARRFFWAFSG